MPISAALPAPQQRQNLAGQLFGPNVGGFVGGLSVNPLFMGGLTTLMGQGPTAGAQIAQATQQGQMQQSEFERQQQQRQRMQEIWGRVFPGGQPAQDHPLTRGLPEQILGLAQAMGPEEGLQFLARHTLQRPEKAPAAIQEYQFDMEQRKAAGQPIVPFSEWSKERKQPLVQMVGESEYQKSRGKALAETYAQVLSEGQQGQQRIAQLEQIDALLSDPSVYTGTGAQSIQALKKAGKTLLGLDFEGVESAEAARRISTEMALSLKSDLPGPLSDSDREFLLNIPPNIGDSAAGRKLLVELMIARERRKVEIAQLARAYRQQYGRLDEGWYDVLAQFNQENPMVTPEMVARAQAAARETPQPSPAAGVARRISSDEEYDALPSGTLFIGPDGQLRRKP